MSIYIQTVLQGLGYKEGAHQVREEINPTLKTLKVSDYALDLMVKRGYIEEPEDKRFSFNPLNEMSRAGYANITSLCPSDDLDDYELLQTLSDAPAYKFDNMNKN